MVRATRLLFQLPTSSRVINKLHPKTQWGWAEIFASKTNFLLETIIWQNSTPQKPSEKAKHKANQPKPFLPEFMKDPVPQSEINKDSVVMPTHEVAQILNLPRG